MADIKICDKCKADITKEMQSSTGHMTFRIGEDEALARKWSFDICPECIKSSLIQFGNDYFINIIKTPESMAN